MADDSPLVDSVAPFDLQSYINRYPVGSDSRLQRLLFIAKTDPESSVQALQLAEQHFRATQNVRGYREVFGIDNDNDNDNDNYNNNNAISMGVVYDSVWVQETERLVHSALETLEARLSAAKAQLQKEAIRTAYLAIGEFFQQHGDLPAALRAVLRSREYCTTRAQTAHLCFLVIELGMSMGNYQLVHDYVAKAAHSNVRGDVEFPLKLKVADGTAYLAEGKFHSAANLLISVSVGENLGLPPEDIALYGTLCGLASLERPVLQSLLDTPGFLDLVPNLREALQLYCRADHPGCLRYLQNLHPMLERDMILAPHLKDLFECILHRLCIEYLKPYSKVNLHHMATIFGVSTERMIALLADLIRSEKIEASRIDYVAQTLERLSEEELLKRRQQATQRKLFAMEQKILNNAHAMMVRVAFMESGPRQHAVKEDYSDDDGTAGPMELSTSVGNPEDTY